MARQAITSFLRVVALAAAVSVPHDADAQSSFDALMARFRSVPGFRADFHEVKRVALLRRPIESSGTIHFAPPARFARHVSGPSWSSVVVEGDSLRLSSATEDRRLSVSRSGGARPFLEGFVGLLSGNRATLDRFFSVRFEPGDSWTLTLVPRTAGSIRSVAIRGRDTRIDGYRIEESSGDDTEVTLSGVDVTHAYTTAEATNAFRPHRP